MPQPHQPNQIILPTYITPIDCPKCGAHAHLMRPSPALTGDGKGEIRTFECMKCGEHTKTFIKDEN